MRSAIFSLAFVALASAAVIPGGPDAPAPLASTLVLSCTLPAGTPSLLNGTALGPALFPKYLNGATFSLNIKLDSGKTKAVIDEPNVYIVAGGTDDASTPATDQIVQVKIATQNGECLPNAPFALVSVTPKSYCAARNGATAVCYAIFDGISNGQSARFHPTPATANMYLYTVDQSTGLLSVAEGSQKVQVAANDGSGDMYGYAAGTKLQSYQAPGQLQLI